MILTHFIAFDFWPGASPSDYVEPVVPDVITSGGAVIVDEPKRKKKKKKTKALKAIEKATEAIKPVEAETPREITEEEAAGMAALYSGIERSQPARVIESPEEIPEVEDVSEPILSDEISKMLFAAQVIQPEKAEILPVVEDETDEIALILAIIEAIG